jgi:hypothetical protein
MHGRHAARSETAFDPVAPAHDVVRAWH